MGKDIYEEFDNIYFDQAEFEKIEDSLSEIEIKRLNKNLKKRIFKQNKRYIKAAAIASITLIIGTSIMTPAFAKTIVQYVPALENLYEKLGYYSEYKDFSQYIGVSKEAQGYKFTIDKLVADQDTVLVALRITKPGLNDEEQGKKSGNNFYIDADVDGLGKGAITGGTMTKRTIDKNTSIVLLENEVAVGKVLPMRFEMNIDIFSTFNGKINVNFKLPVSRQKTKEETIVKKDLGVSEIKEKFNVNINEVKSSPLNTNIKYTTDKSIDKNMDEKTFVSFYCYDDKGNIYLDMGARADDGSKKVGAVSPVEKNARKLYIVPYIYENLSGKQTNYESLDFDGKLYDLNTIREFDMKEDGKINVYKIEKNSDTIKFYYTFTGPDNSLTKQDVIQLYEDNPDKEGAKLIISRKDIKIYKPDSSKPNNYCIEFRNVDGDKNYVYSVGCFPTSKMICGDKIEVNLRK
ncbi:DUF4179 domain-containing protein [Clostridium sp. YIM B02505]|uniref:DUF4179 domain-containing protein n=1 Tax=Clostridium yunnanense TaxID=2800325 RepID=A0ABS1EVM1_9CLOT|nr:DUF4179 domain-containing protein [Clostridium yunnanense]MBK1813386.1 DUF4179 domain-containing protein [Clostridium yunnanense]